MFVFDAANVTFVNSSSMILSGLPNSTAYVQYPPRVNAGTFAKVQPLPTALTFARIFRWMHPACDRNSAGLQASTGTALSLVSLETC